MLRVDEDPSCPPWAKTSLGKHTKNNTRELWRLIGLKIYSAQPQSTLPKFNIAPALNIYHPKRKGSSSKNLLQGYVKLQECIPYTFSCRIFWMFFRCAAPSNSSPQPAVWGHTQCASTKSRTMHHTLGDTRCRRTWAPRFTPKILIKYGRILLMAEILHHVGCINPVIMG